MKFIKSKDANTNYLAKIVKIESFKKHSDPEVSKLKCCTIDGYNMITGIDSQPGLYVYFPTDCCINPEFLKYANLYRDEKLNLDQTKRGMFEENGRVKSIRLRGELSEGFIIPLYVLYAFVINADSPCINKNVFANAGVEFDSIEQDGQLFWINKKYVPKNNIKNASNLKNKNGKSPKGINKLIDGQFHFHYDTTLIKKCPNVIHPSDLISITGKVHGTSGISAFLLCNKKLSISERIISFMTGENKKTYDYLYSSRSVIKNKFYNKNVKKGFYDIDVWKYADEIVRPHLSKGLSIYYEIIGFLPNGGYIQKGYDYGFVSPNEEKQYQYGVNFGIQIYRITLTDPDGLVHEFSAKEVQQWCNNNDLKSVEEYYYGYAKDLYPDIDLTDDWNRKFLERLSNDKSFFMECYSPVCKNKVPHEGLVIKIENMRSEAFKLKCFKFIEGEGKSLDKGEVDLESES